ncbi:MAG: tetratricopeptide repeat protein [Halioglobus sp.]
MNRCWLLGALGVLAACSGLDGARPVPEATLASLPPAVFPASKVALPANTVEEMADSNPEVLQVISEDTVRLQVQHRDVVIELEDGEQNVFVANLLRGMNKFGGGAGGPSGSTLADLDEVSLPENDESLLQVSLEKQADAYRKVLESSVDPATRLQVQHRLADLELAAGEATLPLGDGDIDPANFAQSIEDYEALLRDSPENPANDQVLYQLSRAYALSGDNEQSLAALEQLASRYQGSPLLPEARFRLAESYFAASDYHRAELAYEGVIDAGTDSPYYVNALYMQGWSRFKQGEYSAAIAPFTATLDLVMPADNAMDAIAPGQQEIVQDCLRALAVDFSYLEGATTLAQTYDELGRRSYEVLLYAQLGELYLGQKRYRDSAETYKAFASKFADSELAPQFQLQVIETYEAGGFPELIVQEKQAYVEGFGLTGEYWKNSSAEAQSQIRPHLKQFIGELAAYHHALAQAEHGNDRNPEVAKAHYLAAGSYYQLFIDNFGQDESVPDMAFLLGESRFEAGDYAGAISVYEQVAYQFSDYAKANDAGYAAILAYEQLDPGVKGQPDRQRIESELKFAAAFPADPRVPAVLGNAATALLERSEYEQAGEVAARIISWQPTPDANQLGATWLLLGHSRFELQQYADAEQAYRNALALIPAQDPRHGTAVDRVAASIYRQGEAAAAAGDPESAAGQFARVITAAPESDIRVNAQFDAASNFIQAGDLAEANRLLLDFRSRYPDHELAASIAANLVSNYEQLEDWKAAAAELDSIAAQQPPGEKQRQALYLAASYYERAGASDLAIDRYRSYAKQWPQPPAARMEAMNSLAGLYQRNGKTQEQRYWLEKIIAAHEHAGAEQSERSLYLAAYASSELADEAYQSFSAIKLRYPIKASLDRKKSSMERALDAYQQTAAYGVRQFGTLATYRMGRIYQQLSSDLLLSERPANLDPLALEQYETLLEEQAFPFEEKAIAIYETNAGRVREGLYDQWVRESFTALGELVPARYNKVETSLGFSQEIY